MSGKRNPGGFTLPGNRIIKLKTEIKHNMMKKLFFYLFFGFVVAGCQSEALPTLPNGFTSQTPPPLTVPSPQVTDNPTSRQSIETSKMEIDSYLEGLATTGEFSGTVLIALGEEPVFQGAYGLADRDLGLSNQIDTKFNLGSMDKMFTAVAVMQLVEQGKLSLDENVGTYLPDYPDPEISASVTIHDLLTHTSGLGSYFDSPDYPDDYDQLRSINDYFSLFDDTSLQFPPGEQFLYSNSGFIVLGMIIEAVTGQSYYDYVWEHIFEPSGMGDTACYELDAGTPNLAVGYTTLDEEGNDTGQITDNLYALPMRGGSAGGGYSTAPDLLSFRNALLSHRLLDPESTDLVMEGKIRIGDNAQYAYGFFDRVVKGYRVVGHGGGFPGICSMLNMYTELGLTIIILSNTDYGCMLVNEFLVETLLE